MKRRPPVPEYVDTKGPKKRRFMVRKRVPGNMTLDVGRGKRKFWKDIGGKSDIMYVDSESEARDIDAVYGRGGSNEVWVKEQGNMTHERTYKDDVHSYYFGASKKFSDAWDAFEKRRKDKIEDKSHPRKRKKRAAKKAEVNAIR